MEKTFKREQLVDKFGLPHDPAEGVTVHVDEMCDKGRWHIYYTLVFSEPGQKDGQAWAGSYRRGATEEQYEEPWEHDKEVAFNLVEQREVTVTQWRSVEED